MAGISGESLCVSMLINDKAHHVHISVASSETFGPAALHVLPPAPAYYQLIGPKWSGPQITIRISEIEKERAATRDRGAKDDKFYNIFSRL